METTLTILKPDSVAAGNVGKILDHLIQEGFVIRGLRLIRMTDRQARAFYEVHAERPFYGDLVSFMTAGPVVVVALQRADGVSHLREVMGATDSQKASPGTIRALFGTNIERNAIHGSDSPDNARREVGFFFSESDLLASG